MLLVYHGVLYFSRLTADQVTDPWSEDLRRTLLNSLDTSLDVRPGYHRVDKVR